MWIKHVIHMGRLKKSTVDCNYTAYFVYRHDSTSAFRECGYIQLEQEILTPLAGSGKIYALQVSYNFIKHKI